MNWQPAGFVARAPIKRNRFVLDLLKYQRSLTHFTTALKGNGLMMARLERGHRFRM